MSHFAIVGGAGFIGSHFVDELAFQGHEITVIDNFCSGSAAMLSNHLNKKYFHLKEGNAENTEFLVDCFKGVNTVIHLASNPDIAKAAIEPRIDFSQGTILTESVLEASRRTLVTSILYASGSGVYASSGLTPLAEESTLQPISTYGASKLAGEALLSSYSFMFDLKCIAFRFANVVGAKQTHGVGFDFIRKLKENSSTLDVLGDGTQTKSYIHVSDVVKAVLTAHRKINLGYDVFNVSTKDYLTVKQIAEMSIEIFGSDISKTRIRYGKSDRGWKADVPKILLNSNKIRALGWQSEFSSFEAMFDALKHFTIQERE